MSQREKENQVRLKYLAKIKKLLEDEGEEVLVVGGIKSASKNNFGFMIPTLTEDRDEMTLRIEVSCIRNTVDPYAEAENYKRLLETLEENKK